MSRLMRPADVETLVFTLWESHQRTTARTEVLDLWYRGKQQEVPGDESGTPFIPRDRDARDGEFADVATRVPTNWAGFLVSSMSQTCEIDGVYLPGSNDTLQSYQSWQENRWDSRQTAVYNGAFAHGQSFVSVLPGVSNWEPGKRTARWTGLSALDTTAYYQHHEDEFPMYSLHGEKALDANNVQFYDVTFIDEQAVHYLIVRNQGFDRKDFVYLTGEPHGMVFCPVIQYAPNLDLVGRVTGEIEPFIPLLRRIDQDVFDRLVVQRFGAWVVRYGTGLVEPKTEEEKRAAAMLMRVGDLLASSNDDARFGTLDATPLAGFIEAHDADLRMLAAVSQRPPHHLLGASSNLQAESLAATEQGLQRRSHVARTSFGESHELKMRTSALILGNTAEARAFDMQVRWRDNESRSLSQTADALGKLATQVGVPVEMLWERIPNWTDTDTERAKLLLQADGITALLAQLTDPAAAGKTGAAPAGDPAATA